MSTSDRVQIAAERIGPYAGLSTIRPTTEWSAFADCIEVGGGSLVQRTQKWSFTFCFLAAFVFSNGLIAQNKSVQKLREAQEIRKTHINREGTVSQANISKTLYVDPFIGTGGHGHTYPGATAPFGMMQLSPDTRYEGWDGCSGYHYSDSVIYGFSHTHLSGTGVPDYCDLLLVPQNGTPKTTPGYFDAKNGYGDRFSHDQENASPGFYEVKLLNQQINVRLTVSERAGLHEYTFLNPKGKKFILIDLDHRDQVLSAGMKTHGKNAVSGYRISNSWATRQHFYFHLETSVPFEKIRQVTKNGQHKLLLIFPSSSEKIMVRVGMSAVDENGAKSNLNAEIPDFDFNAVRAKVVKKWETELNKIQFQSKDPSTMIIFYTALYHSFLQPNVFSDVDGRYRGRDEQIHMIENGIPQYTVFSLWDTYRATHPLYTIVQQKRTNEFIHTFLRQHQQGGDLPVWELAGNETECMIGYHSVSVISDAYAKGLRGYDTEKLLEAMIHTSKVDELGKKFFREKGFISSGDEPESVSKTLEYAYNDFCIASMIEKSNSAKFSPLLNEYNKSSLNFINIYDPKTKFMRARRDAMWYAPFDPSEVNFNYTEANSWQYSLYAPHAVDILSGLMGGKDSLESWLDRLFTTEMQLSGRHQVDITGLIGQYAHGNEPSHHMAYLYNYTNTAHKTQHYIDRIQKEMYTTAPDGLSGNEDCGQMSSWYVLSALGLYQIAPGHPFYDFGRPIADQATLKLENGNTLTIKTKNNSSDNKYIQSVSWNGKPWVTNGISHDELMKGGELEFNMGSKPSKTALDHPGSYLKKEHLRAFGFAATPFSLNEERIFDDKIKVSFSHQPSIFGENTLIEYRESTVSKKVQPYEKPILLEYTSKFDVRSIVSYPGEVYQGHEGPEVTVYSPWVSAEFTQRDPSVHLKLSSEYSNQYAAAGPNTLIDGVKGGIEFRTGDYQGFWAQDLVAEVSFDAPRELKELGIKCLQDMKSWIFYPSEILIEVSYDGTNFEKLSVIKTTKTVTHEQTKPDQIPFFSDYVGPTHQEFFRTIDPSKPVHKFRVTAKNHGKCPTWHLGAGNDTWLFTDELIFR